MNLTLEWCCYKTTHPTGLYYTGKAKTANVLNGTYKGSGIAFKLSLQLPDYAWDTWTTVLLQTFATETEAYDCEELLVPHEALYDPMCLNQMCGGLKGKYKTRGTLLKKLNSAKRNANKKIKADKAKAKVAMLKQKIKDLK
jgi:hypothetical protein